MKVTVDELDVFKLCGPKYLVESGSDPWSHSNSTRAAMACLVQAVYALEKDHRSVVKMGLEPLAPDWYTPFKYKLMKVLQVSTEAEAEEERTIIGAVFKWSRRRSLLRPASAPKVVVALRGTVPSLGSDLRADAALLMLQLQNTARFALVLKELEELVARYGLSRVCLAGHSMGAALCLLVGRALLLAHPSDVIIEQQLQAHLFNPPFPSILLDNLLFNAKLRCARLANRLQTVFRDDPPEVDGIYAQRRSTWTDVDDASYVEGGKESDKSPATKILRKNWCPHLYINSCDPICSPYVSYFNNLLRDPGPATAAATGNAQVQGNTSIVHHHYRSTVRKQLLQAGMGREAIFFHLIPAAYMHLVVPAASPNIPEQHHKRLLSTQNLLQSHGMKQWWSQDTEIQTLTVPNL